MIKVVRLLLLFLLAGVPPLSAQVRGTVYYHPGDITALSDSGARGEVSADGMISLFGDSALAVDRPEGPVVIRRESIVRVDLLNSRSWTATSLGLFIGAWATPLLLGQEGYSEGGGLFGGAPQFVPEWGSTGEYHELMFAGAAGGALVGWLVDLGYGREVEVYRFDHPESRNATWNRLLDHLDDNRRSFRIAITGGLISKGTEERFRAHHDRIGPRGSGAPWFVGEYPGPGRMQLLRSIEVSWLPEEWIEIGLVAVDLSLGDRARGILYEENESKWSGYIRTNVNGAGYGVSVAVRPIRRYLPSLLDLRISGDFGLARMTAREDIGLALLDEERGSDFYRVFTHPMARLKVEGLLNLNDRLNVGIQYDYAVAGEIMIEHPADPSLQDAIPFGLSSSTLGFVIGCNL